MDSFELNKIAGAVLFAMLVVVGVSNIGNILVHPRPLAETAFPVAVPETETAAGAPAEAEPQQPIGALLAAANPERGQGIARRCAACHSFEKGGANKVGPNLYGIIGADKAHVDGFGYSTVIANMPGDWSYDDLSAFLADPRGFAPGTKMAFAGIKKAEERADLLAWLRTQSDSPPPLPAQ